MKPHFRPENTGLGTQKTPAGLGARRGQITVRAPKRVAPTYFRKDTAQNKAEFQLIATSLVM